MKQKKRSLCIMLLAALLFVLPAGAATRQMAASKPAENAKETTKSTAKDAAKESAKGTTKGTAKSTAKGTAKDTGGKSGAAKESSAKAHTHEYQQKIVPATLTKDGSISDVCRICKDEKNKKVISRVKTIVLSRTSFPCNGKNQKPEVTVKDAKGKKLDASMYTLSYPASCSKVGTYKVTIRLKGSYSGTPTKSYNITKGEQKIEAPDLEKKMGGASFQLKAKIVEGSKGSSCTYSCSSTSVVKVAKNGKVTIKGVGKATVTATAKATRDYKAAKATFTITVLPKSTSISSLTNPEPGSLLVRWRKTEGVTGYQISVSYLPNFSGARSITVSNQNTTTCTRKNLTKWLRIYVRIRTYKSVGGKKYYSEWSTPKSLRLSK